MVVDDSIVLVKSKRPTIRVIQLSGRFADVWLSSVSCANHQGSPRVGGENGIMISLTAIVWYGQTLASGAGVPSSLSSEYLLLTSTVIALADLVCVGSLSWNSRLDAAPGS